MSENRGFPFFRFLIIIGLSRNSLQFIFIFFFCEIIMCLQDFWLDKLEQKLQKNLKLCIILLYFVHLYLVMQLYIYISLLFKQYYLPVRKSYRPNLIFKDFNMEIKYDTSLTLKFNQNYYCVF